MRNGAGRCDRVLAAVLITGLMWVGDEVAYADKDIPDAHLKITVRQTEQGRVNPSLHVHELKCSGGQCALTTITLNSCRYFPVTRGPAWPLIIERAETTNGSLHVTNQGNTLIVEDKGSDIAVIIRLPNDFSMSGQPTAAL